MYNAAASGDEGFSYRIFREEDEWTLRDSHPGLLLDHIGEDEVSFPTIEEAKAHAEKLERYWNCGEEVSL